MKGRVVIADDEPITRMDIVEMLLEEGYDVVGEASDGFDAIELCKKYKPDLVLMDVKMPLLNGLKAAEVINQDELAECIVLVTAYSGKEFVEEAKKAGAMGYIVKPINEKNLLPALEVAVSKSKEFKEMKQQVKKAQTQLEDRKQIERAKGILMKTEGLSEEEAYNKIRTLSMSKRRSMGEIARIITMNQ
ncbi:ANTAR domain-containing response regulator [Clostridium formicaceticum]|uniref:Stage 0 sporulation protein A homolog n=1 Tax=Clostridium formicaceticum TaxID=1497 RepID=A0AAC9WEX5_9CLOT|nr:response regulator [Clostridium formicaceticum]AOY75785.1 response regulator [Clostridium formicaceticum]ARE86113.1 putative transcriptional regulatory protein pdtaR [Clostridium formicaceticum]